MLKRLTFLAAALLAINCTTGHAQVVLDICCNSGSFADLGDITADGTGGRPAHVRPLGEGEESDRYIFFNSPLTSEDRFPEPPPAEAQAEIVLLEGVQLELTLPQLSHFPQGAEISVEHTIVGTEIEVDASIHFLGWSTDWLAPPHEYVHGLGALPAGDYRITLNVERSFWTNPEDPAVSTGSIDFTVTAIPEPCTALGGLMLTVVSFATTRKLSRI